MIPSRRSDSLLVTRQSLPLLALIGTEQEGHDLGAGAAVVGAESGSRRTVGHAALHGPGHCVSIESIGRHVGEAVHRGGRGAQCAVQERHALSAGAGGVGAEGAVAGTQRDAVLHSPGHSLGVVAVCGNIREAHRALRLGRAGGAPQEGDDVGAGAGAVGVEVAVAGTAGDALLGGPLHSLIVVGVGGNVREVQRLDLSEFRRNRHLGGRHGEGKLAVALVLHLDLAAAGVLHGQGVQLIAAVGLDGDGHGVALAGALRADGHIAVLDRGRGDVIASGGRAGTAAGAGRRVADRPDTVRGAAHIVIACQSAGGVCQIHAGGQTGFCKNRIGISALAASALDDVGVAVAHNVNARVAAERAAGDGDGLAARAAALLNFAIERAIFDIDNSCCVSCSISANNTGKCTVLNVDRTASPCTKVRVGNFLP